MRSSSLPRHQRLAIDLIQRLRPAPLSVILLKCMGLNRRRELPFGEHFFYADPSSQFGMSLLLGSFEPGTVAALEKYLAPGGTFLDLGANEGFFSVLASKLVGPVGQVISVEPQTRLLTILQKNLSLNFCYNCRVAHCVLSDENGKAVIHLSPSNNSGGTSLYRSTPYPLPVESVPSWTLKDFLARAGVQAIDLAKVDIEGAEYRVFMPAGEVLRSGVLRNIVLEFHESILKRRGFAVEQLHEHLLACGYRMDSSLGPSVYEFSPRRQ